MTTFQRARIEAGDRTLEGIYYTSEAIFERERQMITRRHWLCVGRAEQLQSPGAYFLVDVDGESLIIVRGHDGAIRAFYNVCRHRGTRLCRSGEGQFSGTIRCPYHAWSYRFDGSLVSAPHMDEVPDFDIAHWPLVGCAIAEWEGFLWVNLDSEAQAFEQAMAPLVGRFAPWQLDRLRRGAHIHYEVAANWKMIFENYSECYHCPPIHPGLVPLSPADSGRNDFLSGPILGGYMSVQPGAGLTTSGRRSRPAVGTVSGADLERAYYYTFFPNLLFSLHPDYAMVHSLWPEAVDRTRIVCEWYFDPTEMAKPDFDASDAVLFWDEINRQDWQICERTQQGVRSSAYRPGPYAQREGLAAAFDREYLRVLG
ncbi:aromatic ring-hydroxylating oxygenase subunit alpha [Gloeobacter kilaueensis]|uniref:Rieske (2Fe-2S) domain-containing protein n=1 Tax=Gloeobacter kilaueensis (strain ATCC BAA-2537 / CCAP 1431/1 / ULC 316 / JS1) TaxID=1183438 RepID=U5QDE4_GLOK1|nr:aromatic ring-hydroxylating dioxygenase subunit alpha [Gloeobacter kilaueensis]AGY56947.1 Rieske (2Fe-2S) domain-containing protein [Gloeobacter kilaueensis JS1]